MLWARSECVLESSPISVFRVDNKAEQLGALVFRQHPSFAESGLNLGQRVFDHVRPLKQGMFIAQGISRSLPGIIVDIA